jgi:hypothetical protein
MFQRFYLDVAHVMQLFFKCVSCVFVSVSYACFNRFICLQMYVASVVSGCFKNRLSVASPFSPSAALHPSQTGKGARQGMAVRMRAHALAFLYAGK